jgi:hypothetical protein
MKDMKFVKLRKYIESKRGKGSYFFGPIIFLKDTVYDFSTDKLSRLIFRMHNLLFSKKKYDLVFVIARYKENVLWLKNMSYKYVLYNKGPKDIPENMAYINLPNVGREAHTYLTYIVDNYNNLPDYVGFLQGEPFVHSIFLGNILNKFKGQEFYSLGRSAEYYKEEAPIYIKIIEDSTLKYFGIDRPAGKFPWGAQFIVSKNKILKHSLEEYKFLVDKLIEAEKNTTICTEFKHPKPCACMNYISAWMLEVWWPILFEEEKNIINFK